VCSADVGQRYTLHIHTSSGEDDYTLLIHTDDDDVDGYTLHFHTAGNEKGYTLHILTTDAVDGYTLQVHTTDDGKKYPLHIYSDADGKGLHPAHPQCKQQKGKGYILMSTPAGDRKGYALMHTLTKHPCDRVVDCGSESIPRWNRFLTRS
jgi:hypothetical protein